MAHSITAGRVGGLAVPTLVMVLLTACGGDTEKSSPSDYEPARDPVNVGGDADLYQNGRILDVEIAMDESSFEQLRLEGRALASTSRECIPQYEYTEFPATVTIDGERMEDVHVRKKGFIGSLSPTIPSLKLDFNDLWEGRTYQNSSRMTLNNNRQDPSNARQCMAYRQFREAGIAAPRCNYARVTVNGEDLGVFTNVEPIKKPFLSRAFGDDDGNQYEAQTADFGNWLNRRFEKKTNEKENDRTDLTAIADAMALPDEQMLEVLPQLVDLDQWIRFWAVETLLGAWDSASGNANNFHIYRHPEDGRFRFIPWGADTAFRGEHPLKPGTGVLYRNFSLADRLFDIPEYRTMYRAELETLLADQWNETQLLDELTEIRDLTGTDAEATRSLRDFIAGTGEPGDEDYRPSRRVAIEQALADGEPDAQVYRLEDTRPDCAEPVTTALSAEVDSSGGADTGYFGFTLPDGHVVRASLTLAAFETDSLVYQRDTGSSPPVVGLLLIGADINDNYKPYVIQLFIESPQYRPGTWPFHGFATNVLLFEVGENGPEDLRTLALGATGEVSISSVGPEPGDVSLSLDATLEYGPDIQ